MTDYIEGTDPRDDRHDERGRPLVFCDDLCDALMDPETPEDYKAAYEHWRNHSALLGCSHGS